MSALSALRSRSRAERRMLAEAMTMLLVGAFFVALLPFSASARSAAKRPRNRSAPRHPAETIRKVSGAVRACARRAPFRAQCFEQGLAALWMLRRRGIGATLHYGAIQTDGNLVAHVWITASEADVIGCENKDEFHEVARFPPLSSPV